MSSKYEDRARKIHGDKFVEQPRYSHAEREKEWQETVKDKQSVSAFYKKHFPMFPDQMAEAIADFYQKAVSGQIQIPEHYLRKYAQDSKWDYKSELEQQQLEGKIALTTKRLEDMLKEEKDKDESQL